MANETAGAGDVLHFLELLAAEAPARDIEQAARGAADGHGAGTHDDGAVQHARRLALQIHQQFRRGRQREAELAALVDTARDLTSGAPLDTLLRMVTRRARLLTNMDLACVGLLDDPTGDAVIAAADGSVSARTTGSRIPAGSGLGGTADLYLGPAWTPDYLADPCPGRIPALEDIVHAEGLHAVLTVPLRTDDTVIGLLCVAERRSRHFTADEVSLAHSLADIAAAAVRTAHLLESLNAQNAELRHAGSRMRAGLGDALRAKEAEGELVQRVLDGAGLDDLVERAAAELGGSLAVRGPAGQRLAHHGHVPAPDPGELERVQLTATATGIASPLSDGTWIVPLTARGENLGILLHHPGRGVPHERREHILLSCARGVALLLLTQNGSDAEARARDEFLEDLVAAGAGPAGADRARPAPALRRPHVLAVARPQAAAAALAGTWAASYVRHRGMKARRGDDLVLLVPGDDPGRVAEDIREQFARATGATVTVGAAGPVTGAEAVAGCLDKAVRCLEALVALGGTGRAAGDGELGFLGTLLGVEQDADAFIDRVIGPVLDYDAERFSNLVETMEAYFRAAGSPTRAAEMLYVHPNTVSRRMERITQLLGRDWQQPDHALEIQLALRLQRSRTSLATVNAAPRPVTAP